MRELQNLINANKSPRMVRLVFSKLNECKRVTSSLSKEAEVLLLGFLARSFGSSLTDSLDDSGNFNKAIYRLLELIQTYFR